MEFTNEVWPSHCFVPIPTRAMPTPPHSPPPGPHAPPAPQTSDQIFSAKIPHHMLLFVNKSSSAQLVLQDGFRAAAGAFRGEVRRACGGDMVVVRWLQGTLASVLPVPNPGALCGGGRDRVRCRCPALLWPDAR